MTAALLSGHGKLTKACYNAVETLSGTYVNVKTNGTTRGGAGASDTTLWMMDPPLNHTGALQVLGFRVMLQDEEATTLETLTLSYVRYAADGVSPDETPTGLISSHQFTLFSFGKTGRWTVDSSWTLPLPKRLPVTNHGVGIRLGAEPTWPADGLSVVGQFNLPGSPLQPRVPAPFNQQVWAFERPVGQLSATPLDGRVLDTLLLSTIYWVDPVVKIYITSDAYGGPPEDLYGPEAMHPVAARGDTISFFLQGGNDGDQGVAAFFLSPSLAPTPVTLPFVAGSNDFYLDLTPPFPIVLEVGLPDPQHGRLYTPPIPFAAFPPQIREFWVQALIYYPDSGLMRVTDATGVQGL